MKRRNQLIIAALAVAFLVCFIYVMYTPDIESFDNATNDVGNDDTFSMRIHHTQEPSGVQDIPFRVFQYWHSSHIPDTMRNVIEENAKMNPEFDFFVFDDKTSQLFLKKYFNEDVLKAYNDFTPHAYKADMMRLCSIYEKGGVYMDVKFRTVQPLKPYITMNQDHFAQNDGDPKVFNGFFIMKPKDPFLAKCIDRIVEHSKNRYYGQDPHWPTGPGLIGDIVTETNYTVPNKYIHFVLEDNNIHSIIDKTTNQTLLRQYPEYRSEQRSHGGGYWHEWMDKKIYNSADTGM